jgi:hypothetical protein
MAASWCRTPGGPHVQLHRSVAPSYSVEAVQLIGHALSARRHHLIRDLLLLGLLVTMAFTVWTALPADKRALNAIGSIGALTITWAIGWGIRYSTRQQTVAAAVRAYYGGHRLGAAGDLVAITVILAVILAVALAKADLYDEILLLSALLGSAWVVIAVERYVALFLANRGPQVGKGPLQIANDVLALGTDA